MAGFPPPLACRSWTSRYCSFREERPPGPCTRSRSTTPRRCSANLCRRPLIAKSRHEVAHAGRVWHVDVFEGENAGLVLAEVELAHPDEPVALPPWVGAEVTSDPRYRNSAMVDRPMGRSRRSAGLVPARQAHQGTGRWA